MTYPSKKCSCCGTERPNEMFQVRRASRDGLTSSCKICLSERDKKRDSHSRAMQRAEYQKGKGKDIASSAKKRYIERNPKKRSAHVAVGNAIRDGYLKKAPCEVCGSLDVQAHHDDYAKKLSVRWMCPKHHKEHHIINGEGINS